MKALLDTNIIIHREAITPAVHGDVGVLYRWLDRLKYEKCVHPLTVAEIERRGRNLIFTRAKLLQDGDVVVATGTSTLSVITTRP